MRQVITVVYLLFFIGITFSQTNTERIKEIDKEIKVAVDSSDYEKAASLKKEKAILLDIEKAVKEGDYEKAARLKKSLNNKSEKSTEISRKDNLNTEADSVVFLTFNQLNKGMVYIYLNDEYISLTTKGNPILVKLKKGNYNIKITNISKAVLRKNNYVMLDVTMDRNKILNINMTQAKVEKVIKKYEKGDDISEYVYVTNGKLDNNLKQIVYSYNNTDKNKIIVTNDNTKKVVGYKRQGGSVYQYVDFHLMNGALRGTNDFSPITFDIKGRGIAGLGVYWGLGLNLKVYDTESTAVYSPSDDIIQFELYGIVGYRFETKWITPYAEIINGPIYRNVKSTYYTYVPCYYSGISYGYYETNTSSSNYILYGAALRLGASSHLFFKNRFGINVNVTVGNIGAVGYTNNVGFLNLGISWRMSSPEYVGKW